MSIKRKTDRKQTETEKILAETLHPFYNCLNDYVNQLEFVPFLKCSATYAVAQYNGYAWLVLRSYRTIVSAYRLGTQMLVHFGRYSATTYQHQRKFEEYVNKFYNPSDLIISTYWLDYEDWYN